MARIRTIKPDFFTSEDIVGLSPLSRLLYIATWLEADREGRLPWRPKTLKLRYLPGDDCDIDELARELIDAGLVIPYEIEGQQYAEVPSFTRHQVINNREAASEIPARTDDALLTRSPRVADASLTRDDATGTPLVGREGKGKEYASSTRAPIDSSNRSEPKESAKPAKPKPEPIVFDGHGFVGADPYIPSWRQAYPAVELDTEIAKAAAWLVANPKNRKSNVARFLTNWLARAQDRAPPRGGSSAGGRDWT